MSRRRLSWIAALAAIFLSASVVNIAPAAAVGPFAPAETVINGCSDGVGDAAIAVNGTTRGFFNCTGVSSGAIRFFRDTPSSAPAVEISPYVGSVQAVAWDGQNATYVVFTSGGALRIAKREESTGAYSPVTTLTTTGANAIFFTTDVVAVNGQWWAVWSEQVGPGGEFAEIDLFQRHTLLGVQGRTRITTTTDSDDIEPTLAYSGGRVTMVWTRAFASAVPGPSNLMIAQSTGGPWLSRPFATLGNLNSEPDVTISAGVTWVSWSRDSAIFVADNAGGPFVSRRLTTAGSGSTVAVSGSSAFVAWYAFNADRVVIAERAAGVWTSGQVDSPSSRPLRVLAQGTKARVVYLRNQSVLIRTQT
jgi:hypothetical protein